MDVIEHATILAYLEEKRERLAAAKECGGCAVELLDEIIQNVRFMPRAAGFVHIENLVPVKWPEAGYGTRLRRLGEPKIAEYLEDIQAEMQTHEAMFLRLKELERERMEFLKALDGDCETCANTGKCENDPHFCICGSAWKWGETAPVKTAKLYPCFGHGITIHEAAEFACVSPQGFWVQLKKLGGDMEAAIEYYEKRYGGGESQDGKCDGTERRRTGCAEDHRNLRRAG